MDAFELLKADHKKVADLFEKMEDASETALKARRYIFDKIKEELTVHTHIEEKVLYPLVKEMEDTHDLGYEAVEEHRIVKRLIAEIDLLDPDQDEWTAKVKVLMEAVKHHVHEEEHKLFPKTRDCISSDRVEELGDRLQAEKERFMHAMA